MAKQERNTLAQRLRALHVPGSPVLMTNVYDAASANIAASSPATQAVATASYAIAATQGLADEDLTLDQNLTATRLISTAILKSANPTIPLSADLQDGYDDVAAVVKSAIEAGAVGGNIEDLDSGSGGLRSIADAVSRIEIALAAAKEAGVPEFCVNARTDVLCFGGSIDEAVERGKAYLAAGAVTVFVWGGSGGRGVSQDELVKLVGAFDGRLAVKMNLRSGFLNVKELGNLGVARISVGPELFHKAMAGYREAMDKMARGETFA